MALELRFLAPFTPHFCLWVLFWQNASLWPRSSSRKTVTTPSSRFAITEPDSSPHSDRMKKSDDELNMYFLGLLRFPRWLVHWRSSTRIFNGHRPAYTLDHLMLMSHQCPICYLPQQISENLCLFNGHILFASQYALYTIPHCDVKSKSLSRRDSAKWIAIGSAMLGPTTLTTPLIRLQFQQLRAQRPPTALLCAPECAVGTSPLYNTEIKPWNGRDIDCGWFGHTRMDYIHHTTIIIPTPTSSSHRDSQ